MTAIEAICAGSECGPGNLHFAQPVTIRELQTEPRCEDRWKAQALLGFIATARHDRIFLDENSLRVNRGWAKGPETWTVGEPAWLSCDEAEATHQILHWRIDAERRVL